VPPRRAGCEFPTATATATATATSTSTATVLLDGTVGRRHNARGPTVDERSQTMKKLALALALAALASPALAAEKTYQVTGPVLDVSSDSITVQKGNEKWELARSTDTQVSGGDPKKGDKVTIMYKMTATKIEVKPEKAAKAKK
jgi:hypothetical protein